MTSPSLYSTEPIAPEILRRLAPFLFDSPRVDAVPPSLTLFGFSDAERELCLDAIDLCGADGALQAVELYFKDFEDFILPRDEIEDGLSLVRVPNQLSEEVVTWLAISMSALATRARLNVVPVLPALPMRSALLPSISPYCPTLLSSDSDVVDFAIVISAFLRLPRSKCSERFICPGCDRRAGHNAVSASHSRRLGDQQRIAVHEEQRSDVLAFGAPSLFSSLSA